MIRTLFLVLTLVPFSVFSQNNELVKSPKQKSLEIGVRYNFSHVYKGGDNKLFSNNNAPLGITAMFDYGWQVSGFGGKKAAAYMTIPLGYIYMPAMDTNSRTMSILTYGWTVRHELMKGKKWIPFIGYGLMLNSLSFEGIKGRMFGHNTRFEFGVNYELKPKLFPYARVQYSYSPFPQLGSSYSYHLQAFELNAGIRF